MVGMQQQASTPDPQLYDTQSREEEAELALKRTQLSPGAAWLLIIAFLLIVVSELVVQGILEKHKKGSFQALKVFSLLPSLARGETSAAKGLERYWGALATVQEIQSYEKSLEDGSSIGQWLLPRTQDVLTRFTGMGNEQAYIGRDGWLFYRPDVEYLTGSGFLTPEHMKARALSSSASSPLQPDPVQALVDFDRQLRARGITLIVMPAPGKPLIQPEHLSDRYTGENELVQNPSYAAFVRALRQQGIRVFDVSPELAAAAKQAPQYLKTDSHWKPSAMEHAAQLLAGELMKEGLLPAQATLPYSRQRQQVTNYGDIAEMLKLPLAETVTIHPVLQPDGSPWKLQRSADLLVLGDSYCNIYALDGMRWGANAGFVEQLSYFLQRPVDKIVINAGGSYATRKELSKLTSRGLDPLADKRVVIYEFAMRDLLVGGWPCYALDGPLKQPQLATVRPKPVLKSGNLPANNPHPVPEHDTAVPSVPQPPLSPAVPPAPKNNGGNIGRESHLTVTEPNSSIESPVHALHIQGIIAEKTTPPRPNSVAYKDCVIAIHLKDVKAVTGILSDDEFLVFCWGMRDNVWTPAAGYAVGQTVMLTLSPWAEVENEYGGYNRIELNSEGIDTLDLYWGEVN